MTHIITPDKITAFCTALAKASKSGAAVDLGLVAKDVGIKPEPKPLLHCADCGYVGHDYGYTSRNVRNEITAYHCPDDCKNDKGNLIEMLEYDYEDDSIPNASHDEYNNAHDVFHKFLADNAER